MIKRIAAFFILLYAGFWCLQQSDAAGWLPLVKSGGGAATWHTVYDKSSVLAGTDDGGGDQQINLRDVAASTFLTSGSSTTARITILWGTASSTVTGAFITTYFGQRNASTISFKGNQVQVLFGGGAPTSSAAGTNLSDQFTLGETWDSTKDYILAYQIKNDGTVHISQASNTGSTTYFLQTASNESSQTTPTNSASYTTLANTVTSMTKIEILY